MKMPAKSMQELSNESYLNAGNESYLEELYEQYLKDPFSLDEKWQDYFARLKSANDVEISHATIKAQFLALAQSTRRLVPVKMETIKDLQQEKVIELISAFRRFGHLEANIDPLGLYKGEKIKALDLAYYEFNNEDLKNSFSLGSFGNQNDKAPLNDIYQRLKHVYCGSIGFEYMHINRAEEVEWLRQQIEVKWFQFKPSAENKKRILDRLVVADGLEKYLGFKYVGQKRFSLEGGDTLIPLMDVMINKSAKLGVKETIIGMAHRGRLNVLVNVLGKDPKAIFAAFEGTGIPSSHSGDVKYHLGYSSTINTSDGPMHVALAFNPSHLEIVSPVVQGSVRARQRRRGDSDQQQVLPLQIHGDAAFAGQGVVMETFNLSQTRWFKVGGSIHIVINNQVGFTTSNREDSRSTTYCTDIAKMIEAPILHVNANDAEAVYFVGLLAAEYRNLFKKDIVIDLVCYRRHGHNEADEPSATQPLMYQVIKSLKPPYLIYAEKLISEELITEDMLKTMVDQYRQALDEGKIVVDVNQDKASYGFPVNWEPYLNNSWDQKAKTGLSSSKIKDLAHQLEKLPQDFIVQPQVKKMLDSQKKMTEGEIPLNWGYAEIMAYATLLAEGYPIRLCGQDAGRGTFAHRHAVLYDQKTGKPYIPLSHVSSQQAQINIVDSLLSEEAVLAFEYGYATAEPNYLVIWEAQFGDFANGAQVVIDQFISSGEQKWGRLCGLVMLLPHGYEGQGPEHSSARLERYLQLCAEENMQVCMPSTPAQIFHLLRRQMLRNYRKPLIVMTPKNLLRHPLAVSSLEDLTSGEFKLVIPELDEIDIKKVKKVIMCSGKIYYALLEERRNKQLENIAIVRLEQLYPFPTAACENLIAMFPALENLVWCQEEPENQGAWLALQDNLLRLLKKDQKLSFIGRPAAASPAVGYHAIHEKQQEQIITQALH